MTGILHAVFLYLNECMFIQILCYLQRVRVSSIKNRGEMKRACEMVDKFGSKLNAFIIHESTKPNPQFPFDFSVVLWLIEVVFRVADY